MIFLFQQFHQINADILKLYIYFILAFNRNVFLMLTKLIFCLFICLKFEAIIIS